MVTPSQSKSASVTSGNGSVTFTTANLSAGSKIICSIIVSNSSGGVEPVTAVSDGTNPFTKRSSVVVSGALFAEIWDLDTPAGDVGTKPTITATVSTNFGVTMLVQEVAGLATGTTNAAVLDGTPGQNHGTTSPATTGATSSSALSEFTLGLYGDPGDNVTVTLPSGYTADPANVNPSTIATLFSCYKSSANGAESASFTMSGTAVDGWETILLTYKLAAAGSPSLPPRSGRRTAARTPALPQLAARRFRQKFRIPAQVNPPFPFAEISQRRETWPRGLPRRVRVAVPVPRRSAFDADTGHGTDAGETTTARFTDTDTGHGTDAGESTTARFTDTDTGHGTDAGEKIGLSSADASAAAAEAGSVHAALTDTDTGHGTDAGEKIGLSSADTGSGTETANTIAAALSSSDTGSGADAGEKIGQRSADTGAGADAGEKIGLSSADTGSGAEAGSVVVLGGRFNFCDLLLGGTITGNLFGGTAVDPKATYGGTATETNHYGGTATETNAYAGTATETNKYGGTATGNKYGGSASRTNAYGGTITCPS